MKKHPFTLVEILAAIVVVSILTGMGLGIASYASERGKEMRTQSTLKLIETALEQYKRKFGDYPVLYPAAVSSAVNQPLVILPVCTDTTATGDPTNFNANFTGCFSNVVFTDPDTNHRVRIASIGGMGNIGKITISGTEYDVLLDGWDQPILYLYPGYRNRGKYDLGSFGPDKRIGDSGSITFTVDKDSYVITNNQNFGNRNGSPYSSFGTGDDIVNFKR